MAAHPCTDALNPLPLLADQLLLSGFQGLLRTDATFAGCTTYRLGGPIALWAEPAVSDDFTLLGALLASTGQPYFFVGGGTNLLAASRPYPGVVIRLGGSFGFIRQPEPDRLIAGGATTTGTVLRYCREQRLGGLEVLAGVPGTLGGAVAMNAGTMKDWLETAIETVTVVDPHWQVRTLTPAECGFRYRGSRLLDEGWRVLETAFRVTPSTDISPHLQSHTAMRKATQPGGRNAGSNFKNPPGHAAGRLIDEAGCKGWREGGAVVSDLHANFLLAEEGCTPEEVFRLMQRVAHQVEQVHGIRLEPEVILLNFPDPWERTWEGERR